MTGPCWRVLVPHRRRASRPHRMLCPPNSYRFSHCALLACPRSSQVSKTAVAPRSSATTMVVPFERLDSAVMPVVTIAGQSGPANGVHASDARADDDALDDEPAPATIGGSTDDVQVSRAPAAVAYSRAVLRALAPRASISSAAARGSSAAPSPALTASSHPSSPPCATRGPRRASSAEESAMRQGSCPCLCPC